MVGLALISLFCMINASAQDSKALMIDHGVYRTWYRPDLGIPERVEWLLCPYDLGKIKRDPSFRFRPEKSAPKPRVNAAMYTNSSYHRGHLCPAADRSSSKEAMKETFCISNVCPMVPSVNTGAWKNTEIYERQIAGRGYTSSLLACPLFFPQDTNWIGGHRVAVPHAFMKVITIDGDPFFYKIFIVENK